MSIDNLLRIAVKARFSLKRREHLALTTLLAAALMLGATTNLAKVASTTGLLPLSYLTWSLIGATAILTLYSMPRKQLAPLNHRTIEYFVVAGFLTTAGANLIFFHAVPHLGVSFVAMMIALPPLFTYVGAILLRVEPFSGQRASCVVLALAGTALLVARRWEATDSDGVWILLTLLGPVLLAAGNLYRSLRWPPGENAESLAPGMIFAGAGTLVLYAWIFEETLRIDVYSLDAVLLIIIQSAIFAGQFLLMFVLQRTGGPVFLSLMGGVSAVFAVPIAMWLLDESIMPGFSIGALLIAAGVFGVFYSQRAEFSNDYKHFVSEIDEEFE